MCVRVCEVQVSITQESTEIAPTIFQHTHMHTQNWLMLSYFLFNHQLVGLARGVAYRDAHALTHTAFTHFNMGLHASASLCGVVYVCVPAGCMRPLLIDYCYLASPTHLSLRRWAAGN